MSFAKKPDPSKPASEKAEAEAPEATETQQELETDGLEIPEPKDAAGEDDVVDLSGLAKTYEELADENEQLKDRLLRALSDAENTRRRASRDTKDAAKYGMSNFARDLIAKSDRRC
jgi:molecular chaperone GrpE